MSILSKYEFTWTLSLMRKQGKMLKDKPKALSELFKSCDNDIQKELISDLLGRFLYLDEQKFGEALSAMSNHIFDYSYDFDSIALMALTPNSDADSSQEVLQKIKVPVSVLYGKSVKTINRFAKIKKYYDNGTRHFFVVDEFSGSGNTVNQRYDDFLSLNLVDATIHFCFIASMEESQKRMNSRGCDIYSAYILSKGISGYYSGDELITMNNAMIGLEDKLEPQINDTFLSEHSFGYGHAESLYCKEHGNIPNNVFPLFWWKEFLGKHKRCNLFDRVQNGY